ncbi:MAG: hypothetical protein IJA92_00720 [Oscillospiraceae bacterium]|nr:hypothetical protein [Oscillospiraceae bacterium]
MKIESGKLIFKFTAWVIDEACHSERSEESVFTDCHAYLRYARNDKMQ